MKELLDYSARIVDDNGELLTGWENKTIYDFCSDGSMFDFLLDYYKDNQDILPKLHKVYIVKEEPKKNKKFVKIYIKEPEVTHTIDPSIKAMIDSISDQNIRDKMTAYYTKLLLAKQ